ncbi:MAG: hypothetical protein HOP07_17555 [Bacteriovoracaceae bacterium]|nr:hypothetical protein [Bacteriovoracaceae bacterium]NOT80189.1 hypothetical protein [Bacteriovoracaceae bacterium]NOT80795.1 hypothetical protein [Bacteriovoracaceae bacterium]
MHNLNSLFKIDRVPSDTHLRDILETVEYNQYRPLFQRLFHIFKDQKR